MPRQRRQRERQKSNIGLNTQNNNSARASRFFVSLPSLRDYDEKMPKFTFYGGREQATAKFSLSF